MQKNKIIIAVIVLVAVISIILGWKFSKNKLQNKKNNQEFVLINRSDGPYELNLSTKELKSHTNIVTDFSEFSGLPRETKTSQISVMNISTILSQDKKKAVVISTTFDEAKESDEFNGSLPIVIASEFTCDIAIKKCTPTDMIASAYKAAGGAGAWYENSPYYWTKWDSNKNLLYGYLSGEGIGNASPIYIFNTLEKTLQKTNNYDSLNEKEKRAEVPAGTFSPSLARFVMIDENWNAGKSGDKWDLLLYESNNISSPLKKIDISVMKDASATANKIGSVAWSLDERLLVLETNKKIYTLNLDDEKIELRYSDTTEDNSGLWLDFNAVNLSSSGRYIIFVDYAKKTTIDEDSELISTIVTAIDLEDKNKLIELLQEDGVTLDY